MLLELFAEREAVRISELEGELLEGKVGVQQKCFRTVDPDTDRILPDGKPSRNLELLPERLVAHFHLGSQLLPGDPAGTALDLATYEADPVVLLLRVRAAGSKGTKQLLSFEIELDQGALIGALHGCQHLLSRWEELFYSGLVTAHDWLIGHQPHGEEVVIAFCADADKEFKPFSVRLDEGGVLDTREPLDKAAA